MKKIIVLMAIGLFCKTSIAQNLGNHYAIVEMTIPEYNKDKKPLALILSNMIEVPLTETSLGIKVTQSTKLQVKWQFIQYLHKYHKQQLSVFNGGFFEGKVKVWTNKDKQRLDKVMNQNFVQPLKNYTQLITEGFIFDKTKKIDDLVIIQNLKDFLQEGKPLKN